MALDQATLQKLEELASRGDAGRIPYYQTLIAAGDPYAKLALSVVRQDMMAGKVAYSYAIEVAKRYCRPIGPTGWVNLSVALMRADLLARRNPASFDPGKPSLTWRTIRDYHQAAFRDVAHLQPIAWTAWIPLLIVGEAGGAGLWHRMLTEDFLHVAVETAALVLARAAQEARVSRELHQSVVPILRTAPPVVTRARPRDPGFERCMVRLAGEQVQARPGAPGEKLAAFYLDCLASGANVEVPPIPGAPVTLPVNPYGPSWRPTNGDLRRLLIH